MPDDSPQPLMDAAPATMATEFSGLGAAKADGPRQGISKTSEGRPKEEPAPLRDAPNSLRDEPTRAPGPKELAKAIVELNSISADEWISNWEKKNGRLTDEMKEAVHDYKAVLERAKAPKPIGVDNANSNGKGMNKGGEKMSPEIDRAIADFAKTMGQSWDMQMQSAFAQFMSSIKSKRPTVTADIA